MSPFGQVLAQILREAPASIVSGVDVRPSGPLPRSAEISDDG